MAILLVCGLAVTGNLTGKEKLNPEQLIEKHLASIGSPQARAAVESIAAAGEAQVVPRVGGAGRIGGTAQIVSTPGKMLLAMVFAGQADYPHEKISMVDGKVNVANLRPGVRSPLGEFLYVQERPVQEGLLAGALCADWALANVVEQRPKLKYRGVKKIEGTRLHQLDYRPRKRTDLTIRLFFDETTYRHVRSEYRMRIAAAMGATPEESAQQQEQRFTLVEEFSDFREENGLTLPHNYKISYTTEGQRTFMVDWILTLQQFAFNQPLAADIFDVTD